MEKLKPGDRAYWPSRGTQVEIVREEDTTGMTVGPLYTVRFPDGSEEPQVSIKELQPFIER